MLRIIAIIASVFVVAQAIGEFTVLHAPQSVKFSGNEQVDQSSLKEVLSASLGFTTHQGSNWPGISVATPFGYAEAVVVVAIDGVKRLGERTGQTFTLNTDEDESLTWQMLRDRVIQRFPSQNNTLMRVELAQGNNAVEPFNNLLADVDTSIKSIAPLDPSLSEDYELGTEVALLNEIARKVESGPVKHVVFPDIYWFVVSGIQSVSDLHGADSAQTKKAKSLVRDALDNVNRAFRAAYNDRVLIAVVASDNSHVRRTREADAPKAATVDNINLSKSYGTDYAVIFNIILWFSVAFVFAIIATALAIGTMDPGRDSIIYRMTSNRMKKEN